jgi:hypothetical protein
MHISLFFSTKYKMPSFIGGQKQNKIGGGGVECLAFLVKVKYHDFWAFCDMEIHTKKHA